jgi:hypothetical protein
VGLKTYTLINEQKKQFAGVYLLNVMINTPLTVPVLLEGNDQDLEPVLEWLMMKDYIEIKNSEKYLPAEKGREVLKRFMARYSEYLQVFDIYSAVDLELGEFAFAGYFDFDDENEWGKWLNDNRWDDLRLAVAEFKQLDPVEIVFMSFLNEDRFGRDKTGWQFDLLLGSIWDEILNICNTAIKVEELGYEDEYGAVSDEDVISNIIQQGSELMLKLLEKELALEKEQPGPDTDNGDNGKGNNGIGNVPVEKHPPEYYYRYSDPLYVSPVWTTGWLI